MDLLALDLVPPATLELRLGGFEKSVEARLGRLLDLLGEGEVLEEDASHWEAVRDLAFLEGSPVWVKLPAKPHLIPGLEGLPLDPRRYLEGERCSTPGPRRRA